MDNLIHPYMWIYPIGTHESVIQGPTLWCSKQSCHQKCLHPIWASVHLQATPFLIQLPTNSLGQTVQDGPSPHVGNLDETWLPNPSWLSPGIAAIWGMNQWMEELFLSLCHSFKQIYSLLFKKINTKISHHCLLYWELANEVWKDIQKMTKSDFKNYI